MKKISLPALFVAALFGLIVWLSAVMRETYQVTIDAPLRLVNLPEGFAVKTPVPRMLRLRLRGEGWPLAALMLGSNPEIVYPVVLSSGSEGVFRRVRMSHMLTFAEVAERVSLRPGITLVAVQPDSLLLELDRFARKRVPVIPDFAISFREGYGQSGPAVVVPDSVTISGAASVLAGIDDWKTARQVFSDVRVPIDVDLGLAGSDVYDVTPSAERVRLSIAVEPFAEKVFNGLPVEILEPPADREIIFLPPKIEVVIRGGIKRLSNLGNRDFRVTVPYGTIVSDTSGVVDPAVTQPAGVQFVSKKPDRVQYIVRKRQ
jgi:hypothetical protein